MESIYFWLSNLIIVVHLLFILFVLFGGLLVLRRPKWARLHLPAIVWGFLVELNGWLCPLTPWENRLRQLSGRRAYEGDFVGEYLIPLIYPVDLTRDMQMMFAALVVAINACLYLLVWRRYRQKS